MSFIQVVDVIMNSGQRSRLGGPNSLTGKGAYDSNTYRFPIDIGSFDKGHYILFHINEQTTTQFKGTAGPDGDDPVILQNLADLQKRRGDVNFGQSFGTLKNEISGATEYVSEVSDAAGQLGTALLGKFAESDFFKKATDFAGGAVSGIGVAANSINGGFVRKIRRTTDTVALYMPDTMQFQYSQGYTDPSLSNNLLTQGAAAGSAAISGANVSAEQMGRNLSPFIMNMVGGKLGDAGKAIFTAATGMVQNPMLEVIYSSPKLRTFSFTFAFYPRSEAEALEVQRLLDRLRFHQAPEIKSNTGGMFLIPPSEFDIKFMYNGKENPNIDKISTCVLTDIQVDYAKTGGFTAYEVEGENDPRLGRTGMPVGIGLSLTFMETQILTKEYYAGRNTASNDPLGDFIGSIKGIFK